MAKDFRFLNESFAVLQNISGNVRGFEVMHDILMRDTTSFNPTHSSFDFSVDVGRLKRAVDQVQQKTIEMLKKSDPEMKKEDLGKIFYSLMDHCLAMVLSKVWLV